MKGELKEDDEFKIKITPCLEKLNKRRNAKKGESSNGVFPDAFIFEESSLQGKNDRFRIQLYAPVCGVDVITYSNECMAGDTPIVYKGSCKKEEDKGKDFVSKSESFEQLSVPFWPQQQQLRTFKLQQTPKVEPHKPPPEGQPTFER